MLSLGLVLYYDLLRILLPMPKSARPGSLIALMPAISVQFCYRDKSVFSKHRSIEYAQTCGPQVYLEHDFDWPDFSAGRFERLSFSC